MSDATTCKEYNDFKCGCGYCHDCGRARTEHASVQGAPELPPINYSLDVHAQCDALERQLAAAVAEVARLKEENALLTSYKGNADHAANLAILDSQEQDAKLAALQHSHDRLLKVVEIWIGHNLISEAAILESESRTIESARKLRVK